MDWLFRGDYAVAPVSVALLVLSLVLAFLGGQALGWVYMLTHTGLSYSRNFVASLVVIPVLTASVMQVLANNLVTAFGMMAVFAIVRFRNMLRDTLDTTYILLVLALGMATGTQKFATAIGGLAVMVIALLYLWITSFGTRHRYDIILKLRWARPLAELQEVDHLLERHARRSRRASQRADYEKGAGADLSYWLLLRDPARVGDLLTEVRALDGVSHVSSILAEDESEA